MGRRNADFYEAYLDYTYQTEPPTLFKKWAAISSIAGVLQRKCFMRWESTIFPNMYVVVCGPSGNRKSTAIDNVRKFLTELEISISAEATTREALISRIKKSTAVIDPPIEGLEAEHSSISVISSELAVFLGENNGQFLSALTDWFDCRDPWIYSTRGRGDEEIRGIWLNLIGCTTPQLMKLCLPRDAVGGGLTSRMVFVYGEGRSRIVSRPVDHDKLEHKRVALVEDLRDMHSLRGEFDMTEEFIDAQANWYEEQIKKPPSNLVGPLLPYLERRPLHIKKLSMIFNASREDGEMVLDVKDFERARRLLVETEKVMPKTFSMYGDLDEAETYVRILEFIEQRGKLTRGELLNNFWKDIEEDKLDAYLITLKRMEPPMIKMTTDPEKAGSWIEFVGPQQEAE